MVHQPIRWGIMGTGRMAAEFAQAIQQVEGAQLTAIASRSQTSADQFAKRFNILWSGSGYSELLNNAEVDVVYIATPHSLHRELCLMCLEAGKAVLCEKPFAINAVQAREVINLAREKNCFLMEAMWTRCLPAIKKLKKLLSLQAIGNVQLMICGGAFMPEHDSEPYLFNQQLGGGVLLDAGVYLVSMASLVFGSPTKVLAIAEIGKTGVDEHDGVLLSHENGEIANLYVSLRAKSAPDLTLIGDKGKIYLHPPVFCPARLTLSVEGDADEVFDFADQTLGYQHEVLEVNRCLENDLLESHVMPLDETLNIMETMDNIRGQIGLHYPMENERQGDT